MPTAFAVTGFVTDETVFPGRMDDNFDALKDNALHRDDMPGVVAMGGDPATKAVTVMKSGTLGPLHAPARIAGGALDSTLAALDLRLMVGQAAIIAFQDSR